MNLRRLTQHGVAQLAAYLAQLKQDPSLAPPRFLLNDPAASEPLSKDVEVSEQQQFPTRLAAAQYLDGVLSKAGLPQIERDAGLWAWLALFYFDQICPPNRGNAREVGESARYIPAIDVTRRYYRHMLLGPLMMFAAHRDDPNRLLALLSNAMHVATSETYRLFIENPTLISCPAVVATATRLYFDHDRRKLVRGAGSKEAGGCRRLVQFLQQLDCTYDLPLLTEDALVRLLPREFEPFLRRNAQLQLLS